MLFIPSSPLLYTRFPRWALFLLIPVKFIIELILFFLKYAI